ncbi:hypothetical protein APP_18410 [Aeribacillus pallidus]|nr:hypothetical protein APP_18410 [Aeribacillus pallidus]
MKIKPMAIGIEVVPACKLFIASTKPRKTNPKPIFAAIARKIQSDKYR